MNANGSSNPLLIGLDMGTTNVKAVAYTVDGTAVASAVVPTIVHSPRPGWAFYRPDELWHQALSVLRSISGSVRQLGIIEGIDRQHGRIRRAR
jgi:xylulokinase